MVYRRGNHWRKDCARPAWANALWGPPKSYASLSIIPRVTHEANALLKAADNSISLKERYHFLIHGVLIRIHLESGLRVTRETRQVSRSQISVASGLVMTGDKKVHATSSERIAVISNDLCRRVCEIIDLQRRLLKQSSDKSDEQILQTAIDGTGPLLLRLQETGDYSRSEHLKNSVRIKKSSSALFIDNTFTVRGASWLNSN